MSKMTKKIKDILKLYKIFIPSFVEKRIDAEKYSIVKFMEFASKNVKSTDLVLDAGAGTGCYKAYFSHAKYLSTDFDDIFDKDSKNKHDFICSLDDIPKPEASFDVIINTQVLEHVEFPQKVINEFYRVLKPKGKLFLTAPQGWGIHGEPYHFFNFTKYGLESLLKNAGFKILFINPRGGIFWYLGKRIKTLHGYIFFQYFSKKKTHSPSLIYKFLFFLMLPFFLVSILVCNYIIPFMFFYLDSLDRKKDYTLGYACYCVKE